MKRKFTGIYLLTILIMLCTYVPFNLIQTYKDSTIFVRKFGYAPIWYSYIEGKYVTAVDFKQLIIQIVILTMMFAIVYLFLPNKITKQISN